MENYRDMFESPTSAGATKKLPSWEKPQPHAVAWVCDMEGHSKECVEWFCGLANKTTQQFCNSSTPCFDDHHFKEEVGTVVEVSKVCSRIVLKCFSLARNGRLGILGSVNKFARTVTRWSL